MGLALTLAPGGHVAALASPDPAKAEPLRVFAPGLHVLDSVDARFAEYEVDAAGPLKLAGQAW